MGRGAKKSCYAWRVGDEEGVVSSWSACAARVSGRSNARYKGFRTRREALEWLAAGAPWGREYGGLPRRDAELPLVNDDRGPPLDEVGLPEDAVFFDSGTGRGQGTEVNVTDRDGVPLAHLVVAKSRLSPRGTIFLSKGRTNNYGELLACLLAIRVARRLGVRKVFGDSRLVLDYWSKGLLSQQARENTDLVRLARMTAEERAAFEAEGGELLHVRGGINPADLGFHRD